jgi:hypothetical protein
MAWPPSGGRALLIPQTLPLNDRVPPPVTLRLRE